MGDEEEEDFKIRLYYSSTAAEEYQEQLERIRELLDAYVRSAARLTDPQTDTHARAHRFRTTTRSSTSMSTKKTSTMTTRICCFHRFVRE